MTKLIRIIFLIFISLFTTLLSAEEKKEGADPFIESTVELPANRFNSFTFSKSASSYIKFSLYIAAPSLMAIYGFTTWNWNANESFTFRSETYKGTHAINGAADKYGHLYANFISKRFFNFIFKATGSSSNRANIESTLLAEITSLGIEIGDGFSPKYGFDPYDVLFNQIGILFGAILDFSPFLDRIFTLKWEYYPSKQMRAKFDINEYHDFVTDYSGQKFIFSTKVGGIPYLSLTPLRYFNFDLGYYTRGYRNNSYKGKNFYKSRSRHLFIGLSANFSIVFGDLLPVGFISSSIQTYFNYFHPKWDLELKDHVVSDKTHDEFD